MCVLSFCGLLVLFCFVFIFFFLLYFLFFVVFFFFFSSRRRHTRSYGDWSSDVCSSDLTLAWPPTALRRRRRISPSRRAAGLRPRGRAFGRPPGSQSRRSRGRLSTLHS